MADYRVTWDKKKENQLIDYFEAHPCLWDHSHADYFRRGVRDGLMKELSNKLGCDRSGRPYTERHIKMRWKNIRTTYARECRKSESRAEDGSDYVSKWAFIDRLGFIKDFIKSRAPYNCSNNFRLSTLTAVSSDQTDVYQTLSDDDIEEEDDDDLVVCLTEPFKDDNTTQKSNHQDMWDSDDKKSIWISEGVSLANNTSDLKNMDGSKNNLTESWIVQERVSPHRDWRVEERNSGSPSEMWRKGNRESHPSDVATDNLHNNNCTDSSGDIQVGNITYMHNIKNPQSEKNSHGIEDYQQTDTVSLAETLSLNNKVSWSKDKESELIAFFEGHRFLWDHSHPDYFNRDLRDCMIRELSSKLGHDRNGQPYTDGFIRQRWKNLRTTFARELKKIEHHSKHNQETPYISRWAHTERLSFLKDCLKARGHLKVVSRLQNNIDVCPTYSLSDDSDVGNDSIAWPSEQFVEDESPNFEQLSRTKRLDTNLVINSLDLLSDNNNIGGGGGGGGGGNGGGSGGNISINGTVQNFSASTTLKRCRSDDMDLKDDFLKEAWRIFNLKERHDPEDLFGMHVAGTLRRMQPLQREKAKLDIQGILLQHCFSKADQ
ncbi:uncharacterized protein LOC115224823 isoform X1 [Octopus sinensis]|uniref:Uncharacterized protein LOC115224823 isoform X1 n=1 Tax=Octopus sinensis TaxID=2607531 RepID=A0A7E6FS35_9MOLL|nr:uncharacterized protein LOC115224823 isoform X1 [Octopus sinensis]